MSALSTRTTVMQMLTVPILMVAFSAHVEVGTRKMAGYAEVHNVMWYKEQQISYYNMLYTHCRMEIKYNHEHHYVDLSCNCVISLQILTNVLLLLMTVMSMLTVRIYLDHSDVAVGMDMRATGKYVKVRMIVLFFEDLFFMHDINLIVISCDDEVDEHMYSCRYQRVFS